ncbi:hypothetical protein I79_019119 [Cricetulus griseus]|uniref:Secreted protein n=1 Tax=Cricetulus griseus TaxID=10029 RepID=G3I6J5_CRIGR|nr:hypothetical protein I79_019119 [Cricetulus griseus]
MLWCLAHLDVLLGVVRRRTYNQCSQQASASPPTEDVLPPLQKRKGTSNGASRCHIAAAQHEGLLQNCIRQV